MGESSKSKARDAVSQTCYKGQEENNEPSSSTKALHEIEGLLGSKESRQKVTCVTAYFPRLQPLNVPFGDG
jgi:hypothetical protein